MGIVADAGVFGLLLVSFEVLFNSRFGKRGRRMTSRPVEKLAARDAPFPEIRRTHLMTAQTTAPWLDAGHPTFSGELLDVLIEAVMLAPSASGRSAVVCSLIEEIGATVAWRQDGDVDDPADQQELASMRLLVDAARDHHLRMAALAAGHTQVGTR